MAEPIYKQFVPRRTAIYALVTAVFLVFSGAVLAESNPTYTVEGVEVDVTDQNAVKAREKAMDEAQVKAYVMLVERLLGAEQAAAIPAPDPVTASSLVQDFEVVKEQVSNVRYKGVYTVRFRPAAVRAFMSTRGKSYSDTAQKPLMVLPYFETGGMAHLWGDQNPWMRAWRGAAAMPDTLKPTVVPLGDADDMREIVDGSVLDVDPVSFQRLADRYGAEDVAILVASTEPTQTAQGRVVVNVYNNGFEGPTFAQKIVIDQQAGETEDALYTRAVARVKGVLRQNWKANAAYNPNDFKGAPEIVPTQPVAPPVRQPYYSQNAQYGAVPATRPALGPATNYIVTARFSSVQDWVRLKNTLDRLYGMQAVMVKTLKSREAGVSLRYAGNTTALRLALQNAGVTMRAAPAGGIEIFTGAAPANIYGQ